MFGRKSKNVEEKLKRIDELEKELAIAKAELETTFERLLRQVENEYGQKLDHYQIRLVSEIEKIINEIKAGTGKEEIDELRKLVYSKLEEFNALSDELRDLTVKQKSYINLAAKEAVEKALQGELKTIVTLQVKKLISDEGREMLYDESKKSVLGVTKEVTDEIIEEMKSKISKVLVRGEQGSGTVEPENPQLSAEEKKANEQRKNEVLLKERHRSYAKLVGAIGAGLMPMLVGPAGTGKSTAVEQAAYELGFDFYTSNRVQMAHELTGYKDATGNYQPTQFYQAYKYGGVFFLDEIDGSSPEALVTINTAMAQGYMNFPDGRVYMNKDFRLAAAGNTYGTGADAQYVGRNELDAATLDRFVVIRWDYDKKLEKKLIADKDFLKFGWAVRAAVEKMKLPIIISTRGLLNVYSLLKVKAFSLEEVLQSVLFEGVDAQTLLTILRELPNDRTYKPALKKLAGEIAKREVNGDDENEV